MKDYIPKLKGLVNSPLMWAAYCDMLDYYIESQQKKLEQTVDMHEVFKAQGAIQALRKLKQIKDEVNVQQ